MKICETGQRHSVPTIDAGIYLVLDRKIENSDASEEETLGQGDQ